MLAERTRRDVERRLQTDARFEPSWAVLGSRVRAVAEARQAVRQHEAGAVYALRSALVDLSAASEALAGRMGSLRH